MMKILFWLKLFSARDANHQDTNKKKSQLILKTTREYVLLFLFNLNWDFFYVTNMHMSWWWLQIQDNKTLKRQENKLGLPNQGSPNFFLVFFSLFFRVLTSCFCSHVFLFFKFFYLSCDFFDSISRWFASFTCKATIKKKFLKSLLFRAILTAIAHRVLVHTSIQHLKL